jgi:4-amino-4-deoxy-L-arabinose transferase-like glycosyltransferase
VPEYTNEHRNWLGKYALEMPYHVFPWTLIVIAAVRRGWLSLREGMRVRAWRFCIAATVPAFVLLSLAHTGRGIYVAPLLLGVGIACGLWLDAAEERRDRVDIVAIRGSRWLITALAIIFIGGLPLAINFARVESMPLWPSIVGGIIIALALTRSLASTATRYSTTQSVIALYGTYMLVVVGAGLAYFPMVNRQQDLMPIGAALRAELQGRPLALVIPDETTRAMVDLQGITARPLSRQGTLVDDARNFLSERPDARFLVQTHDPRGPVTDWLARYRHNKAPKDSTLDELTRSGLTIEKHYSTPDGRSYALLARRS